MLCIVILCFGLNFYRVFLIDVCWFKNGFVHLGYENLHLWMRR